MDELVLLDTPAVLERLRPLMKDTVDEVDVGTLALAMWGADRLKWADVYVAKDETSFGRIFKDSDQERSKRMCHSGTVVQIAKMPLESAKPVFEGLLMTSGYKVISFLAVASTGELVERSRGRFCGIVTGKYSYSNVGGGQTHAVRMVGMFNLPENVNASP